MRYRHYTGQPQSEQVNQDNALTDISPHRRMIYSAEGQHHALGAAMATLEACCESEAYLLS